jgi:hypothetical protein
MISVTNNPNIINKVAGNWNFKFDTYTNADYDYLSNYITPKLNEMYGENWNLGLTIFQTAIKLRNFIRRWGDRGWLIPNQWNPNGYSGEPYTTELLTITDIINWHEEGNEGFCSWYSSMFMYCCELYGITCRRFGWAMSNGDGDQIAEIYIPELRKWVWMSPLFNRWYSRNGVPLSTCDLHELYHQNKLNEIVAEHDGYLDETASLSYNECGFANYDLWILNHAYTIQMFNQDGYLFAQGNSSKITYCYAPVNPLSNGFTNNLVTDRQYFDWDVNLIKIDENITIDEQININIVDKYLVNLQYYKYERYDINGNKLSGGTTTTDTIQLDKCNKIILYPVNSRNGVGNKIEIIIVDNPIGMLTGNLIYKIYQNNNWISVKIKKN